jgi:RHS repeat-associated protein
MQTLYIYDCTPHFVHSFVLAASRSTGKERDPETGGGDPDKGNDYFEARYYSSTLGRFTTPDPSGLDFADQANPQSLNLYGYAQNNPLVLIDPSGLMTATISCKDVPDTDKYTIDGTVNVQANPAQCEWAYTPDATDLMTLQQKPLPQMKPVAHLFAPNNAANPPACQATLLNMANQQLGTNFNSSNVSGSYMNGTAYNIIIQSNQLTAAQFNNIQQGRYTTSGWQYLTGAGLAGHIADETNLGFAQSAFQSSNIGGNLSVSFAFHDDHGYANNPIGALIHWITDVLGHNTRKPC